MDSIPNENDLDKLKSAESVESFKTALRNAELSTLSGKEEIEKSIEFYKPFQDGVANEHNFMENTLGVFDQVARRPRKAPDYVSRNKYTKEISSEYWYTEDGVIRGSKHWGKGVASCSWAFKYSDGAIAWDKSDSDIVHTNKVEAGAERRGGFSGNASIALLERFKEGD